MRPWTKELPDRLRFEIEEFARRGLAFEVDDHELQVQDRLVMRGNIEVNARSVAISVVYPDSFPYLRPEVYAPELGLDRHQNPFDHNLCLLDRSSRAWNTTDTGAWLVDERLPYLLHLTAQGGQAMRDAETPQGEPATSYFPSEGGMAIFIDEQFLGIPADATHGSIHLAVHGGEALAPRVRAGLVKAASARAGRSGQRWSVAAQAPLRARFNGRTVDGLWVRLPALPPSRDPHALVRLAQTVNPRVATPSWHRTTDGEIALLGIVVPEETQQGEVEDAWLFVVRWRGGRNQAEAACVLRGERLVAADLRSRTPATRGFETRTISLAGLGALGAPLAMELARAQIGDLRLLDGDAVEVGNIVRWPFGLSAVGHAKTDFLVGVIAQEYPLTRCSGFRLRVGAAPQRRPESVESEATVMGRFLDGGNLLIDATAEIGVGQLLAGLAATLTMPLLSIWATEGGWGGGVAEILPARDSGCWHCLQLRLADGSLPAPPAEPGGSVQPRGCAAPTFTGSGFEMLEIVIQAMRSSRRMLLTPPSRSSVRICAMRTPEGGELPAPHWTSHDLAIHPSCPCCVSCAAAA